jgi:hypothetical protein
MVTAIAPELTRKDYQVEHPNDWCPGCGDFGILSAVQQALAALHLRPHQVAIFGGIGCSGKAVYYPANLWCPHAAWPRVAVCHRCQAAHPELTVIAIGGDGDGLGIWSSASRGRSDIQGWPISTCCNHAQRITICTPKTGLPAKTCQRGNRVCTMSNMKATTLSSRQGPMTRRPSIR